MNPWSRFEQAACFPQKCQCEAPIDAWIRQPSAFWSSLAYIFAAIFLVKLSKIKPPGLKAWAIVCGLMGFSSMLGHGTFTKAAMSADFASIVVLLSFFALWNLFQLLKLSYSKIILAFTLYYASVFLVMHMMEKWTKIGVCLLVFGFAIGDVIRELGWSFWRARTLQWSLLVLMISFGFFLLDENHIGCQPHSLWQFHSLWHIGTAISAYLYGTWRFEDIRAL